MVSAGVFTIVAKIFSDISGLLTALVLGLFTGLWLARVVRDHRHKDSADV